VRSAPDATRARPTMSAIPAAPYRPCDAASLFPALGFWTLSFDVGRLGRFTAWHRLCPLVATSLNIAGARRVGVGFWRDPGLLSTGRVSSASLSGPGLGRLIACVVAVPGRVCDPTFLLSARDGFRDASAAVRRSKLLWSPRHRSWARPREVRFCGQCTPYAGRVSGSTPLAAPRH